MTVSARHAGSPTLAVGFGTTVAMWAIGYFCRLSPGLVPSPVVAALMLLTLVGGGVVAGRFARGGWRAGLRAGALSSFLDLLVLGSLLMSGDDARRLAAFWVPGFLVAGALLGAIGGGIGARGYAATAEGASVATEPNWVGAFAKVAMSATFLLVIAGGVVTGAEAGLAVVDWPNSYGYNMFLYPLSRMTGGIYFEHAHRLLGSLVGLTTLVFAAYLFRAEPRRWVRGVGVAALVMVIGQGVLGGLRVTGRFTMSSAPDDVAPNLMLAVVHGVVGQLFLATMVALAVFTSTTWLARTGAVPRANPTIDRRLSAVLVVLLIVQLVLGAVLRHLSSMLLTHVTMAVFVAMLAMVVGMRVGGTKPAPPRLASLGAQLMTAVGLQIALGIGALVVTTMTRDVTPRPLLDIVVTTAHQANGALLLALSVTILLFAHRLLDARAPGEATPERATGSLSSVSSA